jgi:hypothetical protein
MTPSLSLPGAPALSPAEAMFDYDVFVSYSDTDEEWFLAELLAPLESAGVKVIHKGAFDWGVYIADARTRAVERSRHTLIVLTPEWCESQWEGFDALLSGATDPAACLRRLLPLRLRDCTPPARIRHLVAGDFTRPDQRQEAMSQLLRALGRTARAVNEAVAKSAEKGIVALAELVRGHPTVREAVGDTEWSFRESAASIGVIERYKRLHEYFQIVEGSFKPVRKARQAGALDDELEGAVEELIADLDKLINCAKTSGFRPDQISWTGRLERVRADLRNAQTAEDLNGPTERLIQIVGTVPTTLNERLKDAVEKLALGELAQTLAGALAALADTSFDEQAQARLREFAGGVESLRGLDRTLTVLNANHNWLQEVADSLRQIEGTTRPAPRDLATAMEDVRGPLMQLSGAAGAVWVAPLHELVAHLGRALDPLPTEPAAVRAAQNLFKDFRLALNLAFNRADTDLLTFCGQLKGVGDTLLQAIKRMEHV